MTKNNAAFYSTGMHEQSRADMPLTDMVVATIRERIVQGIYVPGAHLSETALCADFDVSRNTLREAFRSLTKEGLLRHESNRGVFVITPDLAAIMDVYSVRRIIEGGAIMRAHPYHAGLKKMHEAINTAEECRGQADWIGAGTADISFHVAIVSLAGSERLSRYFAQLMVELRLIFGLIDDPQYLHEPYIHMNRQMLECLENDETKRAADMLEQYLLRAERMILAAYAQRDV